MSNNKKLKIINVVGARPNFMKMAPLITAMNKFPEEIDHFLIHTGQHYDEKMCKSFFEDLGLPKPDINLEIGSGSHAIQTGGIMVAFEKVLQQVQPHLVIVVGDVNSTMACTITAKKQGVKVAHVEAGLRSGDMSMPEEINRLCTDVLADYLFTTDHFADTNLIDEGVAKKRIHFVGNVMIDTLLSHKKQAESLRTYENFGLHKGAYVVMTMHRPGNVDQQETLQGILTALQNISTEVPIIFPIHPRTMKMIQSFALEDFLQPIAKAPSTINSGLWITEPLGYLDFLNLNMNSRMVLTDSGGLQEETTVLGVPCITMRPNTERPITEEMGTNQVIGNNPDKIIEAVRNILDGKTNTGSVPPKWDGKAGQRIVTTLIDLKEELLK